MYGLRQFCFKFQVEFYKLNRIGEGRDREQNMIKVNFEHGKDSRNTFMNLSCYNQYIQIEALFLLNSIVMRRLTRNWVRMWNIQSRWSWNWMFLFVWNYQITYSHYHSHFSSISNLFDVLSSILFQSIWNMQRENHGSSGFILKWVWSSSELFTWIS